MSNSNKLILFLSTSGISAAYVFYFLLPVAGELAGFDHYMAAVLSPLRESSALPEIVRSQIESAAQLGYGVELSAEVTLRGTYYNSLFFAFSFSFFRLGVLFAFLYLLFNFLLQTKNRFFFFKFYKFLKFNLFLNLPFLGVADALSFFFFFILVLYFSEIHFFFSNLSNLASDTGVYQINFLMLSFSVIFFLKFFKLSSSQGLFFFVSLSLNTALAFTSGVSKKKNNRTTRSTSSFRGSAVFLIAVRLFKFTASGLVFFFFFLSTFFIWVLRYAIQFIRLVVLFMIHTVFELAVVNGDSLLSIGGSLSFFFFKWVFAVFFLFWGFLYLLTYLNLMLTLQVFIFYFFSEIFQSNFLFDLSATVGSRFSKS